MKGLLAYLMIMCLMLATQSGFAGAANHRSNIDRKWKEVEAWQKRQNQRWDKLEREAERSWRGIRGQDRPVENTPYPEFRTCP